MKVLITGIDSYVDAKIKGRLNIFLIKGLLNNSYKKQIYGR
jgi:hypothetical protein